MKRGSGAIGGKAGKKKRANKNDKSSDEAVIESAEIREPVLPEKTIFQTFGEQCFSKYFEKKEGSEELKYDTGKILTQMYEDATEGVLNLDLSTHKTAPLRDLPKYTDFVGTPQLRCACKFKCGTNKQPSTYCVQCTHFLTDEIIAVCSECLDDHRTKGFPEKKGKNKD